MAAATDGTYASRLRRKYGVEDELNRVVTALYEMLATAIGQDKLVLRAGKLGALKMMRSQNLPDRLAALARLVFEDPTIERTSTRAQQRKTIAEIEEAMADLLAQKSVGDAIDKKVSEKMNARHQEYLHDLKLEALSQRTLAASALQQLRPQKLSEIVGQESAIKAMLAKVSSPYPQHVILYGPPGVGKTTAARLVLELAKSRAYTPFAKDAPFVETSGTTLRW
ncbi:MAG TPA: AAA family ATPase, partial [Candidatus Aquilonibacter sp.]